MEQFTEKELYLIEQAKKEYKKEWRKKNKDKIKEYNSRYWLKKAKKEVLDNGK